MFGVHRGFKKLLRIHFAEPLEPFDLNSFATSLFHAGQNFCDREERFDVCFFPFAFDQLEKRFVLRGVMLDAQAFVFDLLKQFGDGFAFVKFFVAGAANNRWLLLLFKDRCVAGFAREDF